MRAILAIAFIFLSTTAWAGPKHPTCQYLYGLTQRLEVIVNEQQLRNVSHDVWQAKDGCTWTYRDFSPVGLVGFYETDRFYFAVVRVRYHDNQAVAWVPDEVFPKNRFRLGAGCEQNPQRLESQGRTVTISNPLRRSDRWNESCDKLYIR